MSSYRQDPASGGSLLAGALGSGIGVTVRGGQLGTDEAGEAGGHPRDGRRLRGPHEPGCVRGSGRLGQVADSAHCAYPRICVLSKEKRSLAKVG